VGLLAGAFIPSGLATTAVSHAKTVKHRKHVKAVKVTVVAKEWSFKLSKTTVPAGSTVAFKVVNKGKIGHDFKIAGKKTKLLAPGKSQTITVKFSKKKKRYAYVCTVTGHARLGMKGTFGVGVSATGGGSGGGGGGGGTTTTPTTTTTAGNVGTAKTTVTGHARLGMKGTFGVGVSATGGGGTGGGGGGGGGTTTTPTTTTTAGNVGTAKTTVTVNMVEYDFQLSQTTIPSGQVTFVVKNSGAEVHNFDINGTKSGALLAPGTTETWTVALAPGQYLYTCDVPFHVSYGMTGTFTVTP
jgi:uncharacterized cupredoxin-like copper-binding protein